MHLARQSVQLRCEPALPCRVDELQGLVQQGQCLFPSSRDLARPGQESYMMGHIHLYPGRAISGQTIAQERQSFRRIAIIVFDPSATDDPVRTPEGKTLLGCYRNHLIYPLTESCVLSEE